MNAKKRQIIQSEIVICSGRRTQRGKKTEAANFTEGGGENKRKKREKGPVKKGVSNGGESAERSSPWSDTSGFTIDKCKGKRRVGNRIEKKQKEGEE